MKKAWSLIIKIDKLWMVQSLLYMVILSAVPTINIIIMQNIINSLSDQIEYGNEIPTILFLFSLQLLSNISSSFVVDHSVYIDKKMEFKLDKEINSKILFISNSIPYQELENPEFYNLLERVKFNPGMRFMQSIKLVLSTLKLFFSLSFLAIYLFEVSPFLSVILMIGIIPIYILSYRYGRLNYFLEVRNSSESREEQYLATVMSDFNYIKEIKIFNGFNYLFSKWTDLKVSVSNSFINLEKRKLWGNLGISFINFFLYIGSIIILLKKILLNQLNLGLVVAIIGSIENFQNLIKELAMSLALQKSNSHFLDEIFTFLSKENKSDIKIKNKSINNNSRCNSEDVNSIEIKNLDFSYGNSNRKVLNNVSFSVKRNQVTAIVGKNGSGKSTLIKLLLGLYNNYQGNIDVEGTEAKNLTQERINSLFTVLFQDFNKYSFSFLENIVYNNSYVPEKLNNILLETGLLELQHSKQLELSTYLGKFLKEGTELSGGQWQKLALARSLYKESSIYIFDEPTASIDPEAEKRFYDSFRKLIKGGTSIFITHKIEATKIADNIIVLNKGTIVEEGNYDSLINKNGVFKKMYEAEINKYKKGEVK